MAKLSPYVNFPGNTEEAFKFYKSVLGGEFTMIQRFGDVPDCGGMPTQFSDKIMHIGLPISNSVILMGTDAIEDMGKKLIQGNNISLSLDTESEEEANRLFNGISAGGTVTMALEKTFWGAYFGMFTDKFGIQWMINYDYNEQA